MKRVTHIFAAIRDVLNSDWDPIAVMDDPEWPRDEYDAYIGHIYKLLVDEASAEAIASYLCTVESNSMGLGEAPISATITVAEKLRAINVRLEF